MSQSHFSFLSFAFAVPLAALVACSSADPPHTTEVNADQVEIVKGVPDRGNDPSVIAIDIGETALCSGTLIAPDVVLTARHCVAVTSEQVACPAKGAQVTRTRTPSSLAILEGDDIKTAKVVAHGHQILTPPGEVLCDADIALVVLDREIPGAEIADVRPHAAAKGEHLRAVGYGKRSDSGPAGVKLARDHVKVLEVSTHEFKVGESTCQGDSGGPAFDESTGEVVGVVSRGGPQCDGATAHNIYTRLDAFEDLIAEAMSKSRGGGHGGTTDGGKPHKSKDGGKSKPPPSDLGAACTKGSDCAAGVCVTASDKQYCSRPCNATDHCPTHFKCARASGGQSVCIEK